MEPEIPRLESLLADYVKAYLLALGNGDESEASEQRRWVYAVLGRLLCRLMEDRDEWPVGAWVDDVAEFNDFHPDEPAPPGELHLLGLMDWGLTGPQWIEPFFASIRVSASGDLLGYQLKCGDAARGLGKIHYGKRIRRWPEGWIFEFESQDQGCAS